MGNTVNNVNNKEILNMNVGMHIRNLMYGNTEEKMNGNSEKGLNSNQASEQSINGVDHEKSDNSDTRTGIWYECGRCSKKFINKNYLKIHEKKHSLEQEKKCFICEKIFSKESHVSSHFKRSHLVSKKKPVLNECSICKKLFLFLAQLKMHMIMIHVTTKLGLGTTEKSYECNTCKEIFDKNGMDAHVKVHMNTNATGSVEEKTYKCHICDKIFENILQVKEHYRLHRNDDQSGRPFKCDVCCKTFTLMVGLKQHLRTHPDEGPFPCYYCGEIFEYSDTLKRHREQKHTNGVSTNPKKWKSRTNSDDCMALMFDCDICEESFSEQNLMIDHRRIHEDVILFECNICKKTFNQSDDLKVHLRKCHVNEQILVGIDKILFECDNCKETFKDDNDLDTHLNIYMNKVSATSLHKPTGNFVFMQLSQNPMEVVDNFPTQTFVHPMVLVPTDEGTIVPIIVNVGTQSAENVIHHDSRVQQQSNDAVAKNMNNGDSVIQVVQNDVELSVDKALPQINQSSALAMNKTTHVQSDVGDVVKAVSSPNAVISRLQEARNESVELDHCYSCHKTRETRTQLFTHMKEMHGSESQKYICNVCQMNYSSKYLLLEHIKKKHEYEYQNYKCYICQEVHRSYTKLLEHKQTHKAAYECEICNKSCILAHTFINHLLNCHVTTHDINGVKSYECDICKNTFEEKDDIEIHMMVHVRNNFGKKVAPECNSSHEALGILSELKRFHCSVCLKTFSCENEFSVHAKTHSEL